MGKKRFTYYKLIVAFGIMLIATILPALSTTYDGCYDNNRWSGYLYNDSTKTETTYLPTEFFTANGADIPDYDPSKPNLHPSFQFADTSCTGSDDWTLSVSGVYEGVGADTATIEIWLSTFTQDEEYKSAKKKKISISMPRKMDKSGLKYFSAPFYMAFKYKNGIIYKLNGTSASDAQIIGGEYYNVCNIMNPAVYWGNYGGRITNLSYVDNSRGNSYSENFSRCDSINLFPDCVPDPEPTIKASYILPSCTDTFLHLSVTSDTLKTFHWLGPDGFKKDFKDTTIKYSDCKSGKYIVWGRINKCTDNVVDTLYITIPKLGEKKEQTLTTCHGDTIYVGAIPHTETGTYIDSLKTTEGCDSIITSHLTFTIIKVDKYDTICVGSKYHFGQQFLTKAGIYTDTTQTAGGCDSITTLHLATYQVSAVVFDTICVGSKYHFGQQLLSKAGIYTDTTQTAEGCDSITTLHLATYQVSAVVFDTICVGSKYHFGQQFLAKAGIYTDTTQTAEGCDSITTLHLATYQVSAVVFDTICVGSKYHFGQQLLSKAGIYTDTTQTAGGCDSITTLHLATYQVSAVVFDTICVGSKYHFGQRFLSKAGIYTDTTQTAGGCDSITTLHLATYQVSAVVFDTICSGQSYTFGNSKLTQSGTYINTSKSSGGCDSITTLHLFVTPPIKAQKYELSLCHNDSISFNGLTFRTAGTFFDTLQTQQGCDSIIIYNVKYLPQFDSTIVYRICETDSVLINGKAYNKSSSFTAATKFDSHECPMRVKYTIYTFPAIKLDDKHYHLCGSKEMRITLDSVKYATYHWWPAEGLSNTEIRTPLVFVDNTRDYQVAISNGYCNDTISVTVATTPYPIIDAASVENDGNNIAIKVHSGIPPYYYQIDTTSDWQTGTEFGHLDIGVHIAYVMDSAGCQASKPFHYFIPIIPAPIMTPNGDGIKDTWEIKNLEHYHVYRIRIFDRWGKLLKEYVNEYPGWDGTYKGIKMPSTDYWYTVNVDLNETNISGHFTLLR
jgi:gliding motility-associated-like protein